MNKLHFEWFTFLDYDKTCWLLANFFVRCKKNIDNKLLFSNTKDI